MSDESTHCRSLAVAVSLMLITKSSCIVRARLAELLFCLASAGAFWSMEQGASVSGFRYSGASRYHGLHPSADCMQVPPAKRIPDPGTRMTARETWFNVNNASYWLKLSGTPASSIRGPTGGHPQAQAPPRSQTPPPRLSETATRSVCPLPSRSLLLTPAGVTVLFCPFQPLFLYRLTNSPQELAARGNTSLLLYLPGAHFGFPRLFVYDRLASPPFPSSSTAIRTRRHIPDLRHANPQIS